MVHWWRDSISTVLYRHGPWSGRVGGAVVDCAVVCAIGVGGADVYRGVRAWLDHGDGAGWDGREPAGIVVTEHRASCLSRVQGLASLGSVAVGLTMMFNIAFGGQLF